jgi:hypothetical protein
MTEEKKQKEADSLQISFPGGKLNLTGDTVKMLIPYLGKMLIIGMIAYAATVILGAMRP